MQSFSPPSRAGDPILIVGASARAACQTHRNAGRAPMALDLFGDRDLAGLATHTVRLRRESYPEGIVTASRGLPPAPFVYSGALENHPAVVARLETTRDNEGTLAEDLSRARDPFVLAEILARASLPHPAVRRPGDGPPAGLAVGQWLVKPLRSAGGHGIHALDARGPAPSGGRLLRGCYLQEHIVGEPCSAAFWAGVEEPPTLLGVSYQLSGRPALGATGYMHCGNLIPSRAQRAALDASGVRERFGELGELLAPSLRLRGYFGIDAVLVDGVPYPVEINPRYTSSVELLERARAHESAGGQRGLGFAKAVIFARRAMRFPGLGALERELKRLPCTRVADIPRDDERIAAGQPVLTCFADAVVDPLRHVDHVARRIHRWLDAAAGTTGAPAPVTEAFS